MQLRPARRRLLHEHHVLRQPLGQRGQHVAGPQRLARPGRRGRLRPREPRRRRIRTRADRARQLRAHRRRLGQQHQLRGAAVRLGRVAGHERDPGVLAHERPGLERVLAEHPRPHHQHEVVAGQRVAHPGAPRGQVAGEQRVVLGEPGPRAERLLPDRAAELLRQLHQRRPRVPESAPAPTTSAGERDSSTIPASSATASGAAARPATDPHRRRRLAVRLGGLEPVVHRHDHERRPRSQPRLVPRPRHRRRHVLRARRLLDRHRVVPGQSLQPPGEERLVRQVAPVLLANDHHQRRAIDPRRGQRGHRVAEPGRGVHEHEGGLAATDRVARCQAHHRPLVEREHEVEVVRHGAQERHLGRPRVGEDRGHPAFAHDLEGRVAHGAGRSLTRHISAPYIEASREGEA